MGGRSAKHATEVSVDVRRDARGLLLVFRTASPPEVAPASVVQAIAPAAPDRFLPM